jgi:hypothetical protein
MISPRLVIFVVAAFGVLMDIHATTPPPAPTTNSLVVPVSVNAATATVSGGGTNTKVSATQVIGNGNGTGYLWEMVPTINSIKTFNPPINLNDLLPADSGWKINSVSSINDNGAIVGTATKISDGTIHGIMLLPCQFSLLNGNQSGTDGLNFDGTRPQKISATMPDNSLPSIDTIGNATYGNAGIDLLGIDPFGQGRPGYSGSAYVASLLVTAKVMPSSPNITYSWDRTLKTREIWIHWEGLGLTGIGWWDALSVNSNALAV